MGGTSTSYLPFFRSLFGGFLAPKHDNSEKQRGDDRAHDANHSTIHVSLLFLNFNYMLFIMGINSRTILIATGPTVTTNKDGRMQKNIGKMSLTPSLAAFSSAICRACTR